MVPMQGYSLTQEGPKMEHKGKLAPSVTALIQGVGEAENLPNEKAFELYTEASGTTANVVSEVFNSMISFFLVNASGASRKED